MKGTGQGQDAPQLVMGSAPFLDEESARLVLWDQIWSQLEPLTPFGLRAKQGLRPYVRGEEAALRSQLAQLQRDVAIDLRVVERVHRLMPQLPDVTAVMTTLNTGPSTLTQKQLFTLKQFLFRGLEVIKGADEGGLEAGDTAGWAELLGHFGEVNTPSFSVTHLGDPVYAQVSQAYVEVISKRTRATQQRDKHWADRCGVRPNREGLLHMPLPASGSLVTELKSDAALRWLHDTPFEAVFEVLPTEAMTTLGAEVDARQAELDDCTHRILADLTDALRHAYKTCEALVMQVTRLDLRLAKVRLQQRWRGSVPSIAEHTELRQGVHPLIADRLHREGRAFVPIDLRPEAGANLLSGANMGGKSVALGLLFICQVLTQYGLPVPAARFQTSLFSLVRMSASGDSDLGAGLSSFGREITRLGQVWHEAQGKGPVLLCFDEPARTTNPVEGEALVMALLESVQRLDSQSVLFVATHFSAPMGEARAKKFQVRGLTAALPPRPPDQGQGDGLAERLKYLEQAMDYRVEEAKTPTSFTEAVTIAQWLGAPDEIITAARGFLQRRGRR